ncbi:MAG: hypothetical protein MUF01_07950 [Bryobacterales bacterium]|nr:hypothetical protein [Bryobacterales bacterium]
MFKTLFTFAFATVFAAGSLLAADAATNHSSSLSKDDLVKELSTLREQAMQVANLAKNKRSNSNDVRPQVEAVHESARKIRAMVQQNPDYFGPTGSERRQFVEVTAEVMEVLATNKLNLVDQYNEGRNREAVRGHASGIADRVTRLERTLTSPRS